MTISKAGRTARQVLLALVLSISPALAGQDPIEIGWEDLIPTDGNALEQAYDTLGVVQHDQITTPPEPGSPSPVTDAFNGIRVRLPGYVVPLEFQGAGVTTFLLVPYIGACIHVPPPPANQLVLVTTQEPQSFNGLFEPVWVTGVFESDSVSTDLADVGYSLAADHVEPYQ